MPFSSVKRRKVEADFSGGDITSNGGALLLSAVDKRLQITKAIDKVLTNSGNF